MDGYLLMNAVAGQQDEDDLRGRYVSVSPGPADRTAHPTHLGGVNVARALTVGRTRRGSEGSAGERTQRPHAELLQRSTVSGRCRGTRR